MLFSSKFIKQSAAKNNIIIYLLGRLTYPVSVLLARIGLSPNQITTLSIIFAFLSSLALIFDRGWSLFILFWTISLILDFCDGTVARMTGRIRKSAFRYDHTSDLFKIFVVILGVAIRFNDEWVWVTALSSIFFFMYYILLNSDATTSSQVISLVKNMRNEIKGDLGYSDYRELTLKEKIKSYMQDGIIKDVFYNLYTIVFSINGHTLLLFLFFVFGKDIVISVFLYLTILSLIGVWKNINKLRALEKV